MWKCSIGYDLELLSKRCLTGQVSGVNLSLTRQIWTKTFIKTADEIRCILELTGEITTFFDDDGKAKEQKVSQNRFFGQILEGIKCQKTGFL